jgi:leader peptidase (prepilin peptidase) / N-methyltransferase
MDNTIFLVCVAIMSPIFASFFSVIIYRVPRGESIVFPGSHCTTCDPPRRLSVIELIPILGWLVTGGKCRHCGNQVAFRYLLLELLLPVLMVYTAWQSGPGWLFARNAILISLLLILTFIDLDTMELPFKFTLPGIASGVIFSICGIGQDWHQMWRGLGLGIALPLAISLIYLLIRKKEGMGGGDFILLAMVGAHMGPVLVILTLVLGAFAGTVVNLAGLATAETKEAWLERKIPFGPFLVCGALVSLFWGRTIIDAYLKLSGMA